MCIQFPRAPSTRSRLIPPTIHPGTPQLPIPRKPVTKGSSRTRRNLSRKHSTCLTATADSRHTILPRRNLVQEENKEVSDIVPPKDRCVGSQSGSVSHSNVTFRPQFKYFRWKGRWHVIPLKYELLPETEVNRRMKIKLRTRGRVPWNRGLHFSTGAQRFFEKCEKSDLGWTNGSQAEVVNATSKNGLYEMEINQQNEGVQKEEERRRKISEAIKKKWLDPTYRKRATERLQQKRSETNGIFDAEKMQQMEKETFKAVKKCRKKYNDLRRTLSRLILETDTLKVHRTDDPPDNEVTTEVQDAVDIAKTTISKIQNTLIKMEEELKLNPNTNLDGHNIQTNS